MGHTQFGQLRLRIKTILHEQIDLAIAQPIRLLRFQARPIQTTQAIDLAALHRQKNICRALIASNQFDLGAIHILMHGGIVARCAPCGTGPKNGLIFECGFECFDLRIDVSQTYARAAISRANIDEFGRIKQIGRLLINQASHDRARHQRTNRRAILGRHCVNIATRQCRTSTWHIAGHKSGRTGDETPHMARQSTGINVIAAAHISADQQINRLAGIKISRSGLNCSQTQHKTKSASCQQSVPNAHCLPSC